MLTIAIPIFEEPKLVEKAIEMNSEIFSKYPLVIVNKSGGDQFKLLQLGVKFFDQDSTWWDARKFMLDYVKTKYVLCLDLDTILPPHYISSALSILESRPEVACVALNYTEPCRQGHLAFGTSIWRLDVLKKLYDWNKGEGKPCECVYMWAKVKAEGMIVETLPMEAIHLKEGEINLTKLPSKYQIPATEVIDGITVTHGRWKNDH